jgi:hypothetical protein
MICKKTLILKPTDIEALTAGTEYSINDEDETGVYILNNQSDLHHFSDADKLEYFE